MPRNMAVTETLERMRHSAIVDRPTDQAGITGRRVSPPIERLLSRNRITGRMFSAGQRIRNHFDLGVCGARDHDDELPPGIRCASLARTPSEVQLDALTAYKAALRSLGAHVGAVVVAVCCYERDVTTVATQMHQDRQEVMGVLKAGLKTLADHYRLHGNDDHAQDVDASRRRVA